MNLWNLVTNYEAPIPFPFFGKAGEVNARPYHNFNHVREMHGVIAHSDLDGASMQIAMDAAVWHDYVYVPGAKDNEERSANAYVANLKAGGRGNSSPALVVAAILATKKHVASNPVEQVLIDADLFILAAPPKRYREYADGIAKEYGYLEDGNGKPWGEYREGRRAFLEWVASRSVIFYDKDLNIAFNDAVQRNTAAERVALNTPRYHWAGAYARDE